MGNLDISTGEWITIALAALALGVEIVAAIISWRAYRRPPTTVTFGYWQIEHHSWAAYEAAPQHSGFEAKGTVSISPSGTSFTITDVRCELRAKGRVAVLELVNPVLGVLYNGGQTMGLHFHEKGPKSVFDHPYPKVFDVDVRIRLADGSFAHNKQRNVTAGVSVINLRALYTPPDRSTSEMVRRAVQLARRGSTSLWQATIGRLVHELRHGDR